MRKVLYHSIIAKAKSVGADKWLAGILILGAILRLFHIAQITEFLGDQGRTSMHLDAWLRGGSMPLVGPTTLTGQHLGPVFYFILAPFYVLGGFSPIGLSVGMALLGVFAIYALYVVVKLMYGKFPALCLALLYAVSPVIVRQDRIIWEPNLVQLFGFLFAYFAVRAYKKVHFWDNIGLGVMVGVLVQLHYPNLFFLGLSGLFYIALAFRIRQWATVAKAIGAWTAGFIFVLIPFLIHEFANGFVDIREIFQIILTGSSGMGKRQTLTYVLDYGGRVFGFILPNISLWLVVAFFVGWAVFLAIQFTSLNIFWTCWFGIGLFMIARYNGVVHDHYLLFLLPPVMFGFASIMRWMLKTQSLLWFFLCLVGFICYVQLSRTDAFTVGTLDVARTNKLVEAIKKDASGSSFSFTLTASRSFSDLHYRYFFLQHDVEPVSITDGTYEKFYVACDSSVCPTASELIAQKLPVLCFDPHCEGEYPKIDLSQSFVYEKTIQVPIVRDQTSLVYVFSQRTISK